MHVAQPPIYFVALLPIFNSRTLDSGLHSTLQTHCFEITSSFIMVIVPINGVPSFSKPRNQQVYDTSYELVLHEVLQCCHIQVKLVQRLLVSE